MRVLVACECSQTVCKAFRKRGHEAYSCDIQMCYGEDPRPEWHILGDVRLVLEPDTQGATGFNCANGDVHMWYGTWDLIIAHHPCTYLTVTGNRWFNVQRYGQTAIDRQKQRDDGARFFMEFVHAPCPKIAVESPVGCMSRIYRKPDQIIQPYQFGHPTTKKTCLWLKGLPNLEPTNVVDVDTQDVYAYVAKNGRIKHDCRSRSRGKASERANHRSKTFQGIADAMAEQWG